MTKPQKQLELEVVLAIDQALRAIDLQLMAGHHESAQNLVRIAIADAKLLRTLLTNRDQDAVNRLES